MANNYTSSNIVNGLMFDELLGKLLTYKPNQWGFTEQDFNEIATDFNVSSNDLYYLSAGNYKITNLPNSPIDSSFVNISVYDLGSDKYILCDIGGIEKYSTTLSNAGATVLWTDISDSQRTGVDAVLINVGSYAPSDTTMVWIDTSKLSTADEVFLKYYNGTEWVSYTSNTIMLENIYDTQGLKKDPYETVMDILEKFSNEYSEFTRHRNDEMVLIHITASDKEYYNTFLLTTNTLANYFAENGPLYNELVSYIDNRIKYVTDFDNEENSNAINAIGSSFNEHLNDHITESDAINWDSKANSDHDHYLDEKVIINSSDITASATSTSFNSNQISSLSKERAYPITNISILASPPSAEDIANKYHNGNTLYVENGDGTSTWWKIVDNTKFGTADYQNGLKLFSAEIEPVTFAGLVNKPTTLAGYKITDGVTTAEFETLNTTVNNLIYAQYTPEDYAVGKVANNNLYVGIQKTLKASGGGNDSYPMANPYSDLDIIMAIDNGNLAAFVDKFSCNAKGSGSWVERPVGTSNKYWYAVCYGNGKYVAVAYNSTAFAYSKDGINWTEGTISSTSRMWNSICYGNGKFVIASESSNIFAYSIDGINWTEATVGTTSKAWKSVCYGNGKFVAVINYSNIYAYSTDGIIWKESTIGSNRAWAYVGYCNDRYIAVASGSSAFAYSTDGITWKSGTISSTSRNWQSVCYGNGKYVAISYGTNIFAYSTDGITWKEITVGTENRNWRIICYGNGKFIAVAYNSNKFAYSNDGITWTEGTISSTNRNWQYVCYGNDKFVAVAFTSTIVAYSTNQSYHEVGLSQKPTDILASKYFSTAYSSDSANPNWASNGLGRMIKVNTSINNTIINADYTINGSTYNVLIRWDTTVGIIFEIRTDKAIKSAQEIYNRLIEMQSSVNNEISYYERLI